jgi:hypothetical protein
MKVFNKLITLTSQETQTVDLKDTAHAFLIKNFDTQNPLYISFEPDPQESDFIKIPANFYQIITMSETNATARIVKVKGNTDQEIEISTLPNNVAPAMGSLGAAASSSTIQGHTYTLNSSLSDIVSGDMNIDLHQDSETTPVSSVALVGDINLTESQLRELGNGDTTTLTSEQMEIVKKYKTIGLWFNSAYVLMEKKIMMPSGNNSGEYRIGFQCLIDGIQDQIGLNAYIHTNDNTLHIQFARLGYFISSTDPATTPCDSDNELPKIIELSSLDMGDKTLEIFPDLTDTDPSHMYALVMCSNNRDNDWHLEWKDIGANPDYIAPDM